MAHVENNDIQKYRRPLHFISSAYVNGYFWISALEWNGYYKLDPRDGRTEFLGIFEHEDIIADKLFYQTLSYENFVFFIPWFSNYLVRLDTKTLELQYWKLPESIVKETAKFRAANIYSQKIYMFPMVGQTICIFDIKEEKFVCEGNWIKEKKLKNGNGDFLQGCFVKDTIYLPACFNNMVFKYKLSDDMHKCIEFPEDEKAIIDITYFNEDELLILSWKGNIWKYYVTIDEKEIIYEYDGTEENPYSCIINCNEYLCLLPAKEKNIKILERKIEGNLSYPTEWKMRYIDVGVDSLFTGYCKYDSNIMLYSPLGNMLLKLDISKKLLLGIRVYDDFVQRRKEIRKSIKTSCFSQQISESKKMKLDFFIDVIEDKKEQKETYLEENGKEIWKQLSWRFT